MSVLNHRDATQPHATITPEAKKSTCNTEKTGKNKCNRACASKGMSNTATNNPTSRHSLRVGKIDRHRQQDLIPLLLLKVQHMTGHCIGAVGPAFALRQLLDAMLGHRSFKSQQILSTCHHFQRLHELTSVDTQVQAAHPQSVRETCKASCIVEVNIATVPRRLPSEICLRTVQCNRSSTQTQQRSRAVVVAMCIVLLCLKGSAESG